ncbi:MAG: hypothetical protein M1837_004675 [Sclerophora amabilis]|nr:MAG: hypothetical protein M1837_004675 [Sclerophora amabilis]
MWPTYAAIILSTLQCVVAQTDRTGWTATANSFQSGNEPAKVLDGTNTIWHSQYSPNAPLPHNIVIDMKRTYNVNGLSYLPRQDGSSNGNIGEHRIQLSADGVNWGTPVAIGTWLDDRSLKKTLFVTKPARYVRLTALTEAGGRGTWSSAAEINMFTTASYTPPPTNKGQWSNTVDFPIVPAAAAILPSENVVLWSSYKATDFNGGSGSGLTLTTTFNPATGAVPQRSVSNTRHDMFCPGLSMDFSGRAVVTGGNDAAKTSIYDLGSGGWSAAADMRIARGYQSQTTLSDGRIFTIGGSWSGARGGKNGEVYSPSANTWTLLSGCPVAPMLTNDAEGIFRSDNHAWLFGWKNGFVFQAGPSKAMNWYGTSGSGSRSSAGNRLNDPDSMDGNAVMYDAVNGKILTVGGSPSYQYSDATKNAHVITIGNPGSQPTVTQVSSMAYARAFHNSIVLPDGKVFVTGGQSYPIPFSDNTAIMIPELWNPATSTFTQMNPMAIPRTYHSVAILLPDATVLNAGGGLCGGCATNHLDGEIFVPPYLFRSDGTRATRPRINSVSSGTVNVGGTITVTMDSAVTSFSLIRGSSSTHTVNTDQRRIPLTPTASGLTYTVTVPADAGVALPGYWMLFAINSAGVPSVARSITIR